MGSLTRGRGQRRLPDGSEAAMEPYNHPCRPRGDTECSQTKWKEVTHRRLESWRVRVAAREPAWIRGLFHVLKYRNKCRCEKNVDV